MLFQFSKRDYRFFEISRSVSQQSDFRVQVGCIAVYKGRVVASGYSTNKTSPVQARFNSFRNFNDCNTISHKLHAEVQTILQLKKMNINFKKVSLYIWRGKSCPRLSRPCPACAAAIAELGITDIFYTGENSFIFEKKLTG